MGEAGGVDNDSLSNQKDDLWFWPYRPADYKVPYIDAKSGIQKRVDALEAQVDALEAQVAELTGLIKEFQKGERDKEAGLFVRTELS